ncbi:hypothetical protein C0J50_5923 [Silurus asotus]|uniref:Uncharacterized protein n=1 Tax=Silurus asotus TaxID=30991 RepID=A0AAD5A3T6_SILAS|nr:hypothetical protein C0J50_5923 [Silurus asotus]
MAEEERVSHPGFIPARYSALLIISSSPEQNIQDFIAPELHRALRAVYEPSSEIKTGFSSECVDSLGAF